MFQPLKTFRTNGSIASAIGNLYLPAIMQTAGIKNFLPPKDFSHIEIPERQKLPVMPRVPNFPAMTKPPKMQKNLKFIKGPEEVHNKLIHKQYGIIALAGGRLRSGHFEMMRLTLGRKIDTKRMFLVYRVDSPWQPITKKGQGQRMGGGKGSINHYVTPVKANRVILELGGRCEFEEVLIAVLAVAAAEEVAREKKQAIVGAYPYAYGYAGDDGSYYPGKYEGTGVAPFYRYAAYPYNYGYNYAAPAYAAHAYAAHAYAAPAYSAHAYSAYPYHYNYAAKYVAAPVAAAPVVAAAPAVVAAAPAVVAKSVAPVVPAYYAAKDDGSYFPGKYGPEYQL